MKFKLKKDIVIKAGTVFGCVDGESREYVSGNYSTIFSLSKDTSGELIYGIDLSDYPEQTNEWFEEVKEKLNIWTCKIGESSKPLISGSDAPMRAAIEKVYFELTGEQPKFLFSGWGGELDDEERQEVKE